MSERVLVALLVVIAVVAAIPQAAFLDWGIVLVILGLIAGAMGNSNSATDRTLIYVLAIALPAFSDSLNVIPTIGPLVNLVLDNLATGIQGMAVAVVLVALYGRLNPGAR